MGRTGIDVIGATTAANEMINAIAAEMSVGVDTAVECWMAQVEQASTDATSTASERIAAIQEILTCYKRLTGKSQLHSRRA